MSSEIPAAERLDRRNTPESAESDDMPAQHEESFSELLAQYERGFEKPAEDADGVLHGTVVSERADGVFVDIGRKSEAFLPLEPFPGTDEKPELKVGEQVAVRIRERSDDGYLVLSFADRQRPKTWRDLQSAFESQSTIVGKVTEVIKGGLSVDVGVRAFLPASRSGAREAPEMEALVGQEILCKIMQLDPEDDNVVLDRRTVLEEEAARRRHEAIARLEPGMTVKGTVRNIRDFGAFIDLGGVDGLLHVSDLSWGKVKDVSSVLSEGQSFDVKILKVEQEGKRISVGVKQLTPDPWTLIAQKLQVGDRIRGTVTRLADYGAFVELEPGVEGLIHVSEMSWARRVRHPKDLLNEGDLVDVAVLEINLADRRIALGMKQTLGDPWDRAEKELPPGTVVEGTVRNLARFGAFVEVMEGVEGLIHVSDIVADKRLNHPNEALKEGQKVKAVVLELSREKRRLKLGMKQLEPTAQDEVIEELKLGDTVTGRVVRVGANEAVVELGEGVRAVCRIPAGTAALQAETPPPDRSALNVSSMGELLRAAWKGGAGEKSAAAAEASATVLKASEVRSFKVSKLDPKNRLIELTLT